MERRWAVSDERWTMNDERWVGTLRAASEDFYSRKSRKSRQRFRVIFREIITLVSSSDAARNVPTSLTTHRPSLASLPFPVLQTALRECYLIPRVQEPAAIRPSGATPSGRGIIMKMRLEDRIFHISMRRGNVGTSACSVWGFYSRKSHQSQRFRVIFVRL